MPRTSVFGQHAVERAEDAVEEPGTDSRTAAVAMPTQMSRRSGFFGEEQPEDLLAMGGTVEEAEQFLKSDKYKLLQEAQLEKAEAALQEDMNRQAEEAEQQQAADRQAMRGERQVSGSTPSEENEQFNRALERALKECPIRTRFNPNMKREITRMRQKAGTEQLAHDLSSMSKLHRGETELNNRSAFRSSATQNLARQASVVTSSVKDVIKSTLKGNVLSTESSDKNYADLLSKANSHITKDEVLQSLTPSAMAALRRQRSMESIKSTCGLTEKQRKTQLQILREKGMFFCGSQDAAMKRQGLPSAAATAKPVEEKASSSEEDEEEKQLLEGRKKKAIITAADDLELFLHRSGGGAVKRRPPQSHDAAFDFAENRICMPRVLNDNHAGQFIVVDPDLNDDGTGNILMKTQLPRRQCMAGIPNVLDLVVDMKKLDELSKSQCDDATGGVARRVHRPPPSVKDWEAWREIQRKKRMENSNEDAIKKMREGLPKVEAEAEGGASPQGDKTGRKGSKDTSPAGAGGGGGYRRALRQENETLIVAEAISPPWDGKPPASPEELEDILATLGLQDEMATKAAGRAEEELASDPGDDVTALERADWIVRAVGPNPLQFNFKVFMSREDLLMPEDFGWSLDADDLAQQENEQAFWEDFFTPLPGASIFQRLQQQLFQNCDTIQKKGDNLLHQRIC